MCRNKRRDCKHFSNIQSIYNWTSLLFLKREAIRWRSLFTFCCKFPVRAKDVFIWVTKREEEACQNTKQPTVFVYKWGKSAFVCWKDSKECESVWNWAFFEINQPLELLEQKQQKIEPEVNFNVIRVGMTRTQDIILQSSILLTLLKSMNTQPTEV